MLSRVSGPQHAGLLGHSWPTGAGGLTRPCVLCAGMYKAVNYQSSLDSMSIDIAAPLDFGMQTCKRPDRLPLRLTFPICGHSKYVLSVDYVQTNLYCANVSQR